MRYVLLAVLALGWLFVAMPVGAEPYLAVRSGNQCLTCHVNKTGGGKRTVYGNAFGQVTMPARAPESFWNGVVMDYLAVGANLRAGAIATNTPGEDDTFEFDVEEAQIYLEFPLLPSLFTIYMDQQVSPGTNTREIFGLFTLLKNKAWIKAGRIFRPFGWRLEDDSEFVREVVGYNMNTPDDGVEAGITLNGFEVILAVTNGSAGGPEDNTGKQFSLLASYISNMWRVGFSGNFNDAGEDERSVVGGFAGLRTGPISWLGEIDYIDDQSLGTDGRKQVVGFVEGNWLIRQGHNLKLTYGGFDPDDDVSNDQQNRYSIVYEYIPFS